MIKNLLFTGILVSILWACKQDKKAPMAVATTTIDAPIAVPEKLVVTPETIAQAVIYEANIRQYSPEGTFEAFSNDIPKLKELGVKIIWLMPVFPISTTKSKGTLGSYYAVSDYTKINPEFGTLTDFKKLVKTAHDNGMYVILDWVANHTGWDHKWIKEHPEFYTKDKKGAITHTVDTDWTDVADLNYDNHEMRTAMQQAMHYWVAEENVDGFRCDVAGMVPTDFWNETSAMLQKEKALFMLAEGWEPALLETAFDMGYSWDTHHVMNAIAKGEKDTKALEDRLTAIDSLYKDDAILMNFVTNHDENSWNGTITERMGAAADIMTVLSYTLPGMPLIYSGQEYGMNKRLRFFEKDTIIKTKGATWKLLKKLGQLKKSPALKGGTNKGAFKKIATSRKKQVVAFERSHQNDKVIFLGNMSKEPVQFIADFTGDYKSFFSGEKILSTEGKTYELAAWEYLVLIEKPTL